MVDPNDTYQSLPNKYSYIEFHDHAPKIWLTRMDRNFGTFFCFTLSPIKEIPNTPPDYKSYLNLRPNLLFKELRQFFLSGFSAYNLAVGLFL